jgi:hypothetical protein
MKIFRISLLVSLLQLALLASLAQDSTQTQKPTEPQQPTATAAAPPTSVAEQIRKAVGFLGVAYRNGSVQGAIIGTCFFVWVPDKRLGEDQGFIYLITNRHVAQPGIDVGAPYEVQALYLRLNLLNAAGEVQSVQEQIPLGGRIRWFYPADDAVDLAILPVAPNLKKYDYLPIPSTALATSEKIKSSAIGIGDSVTFAGYFSSFPGHKRVEPIVRQGVIAMLPDEKLDTTLHKPGQLFLADLHAFHGNSGSPVFVNVSGMRHGTLLVGESYLLLGIISGYYPESAGFSVPAATVLTGQVRDNSGIATIVPAEELTKLLDSVEVRAYRDRQVAILTRKP